MNINLVPNRKARTLRQTIVRIMVQRVVAFVMIAGGLVGAITLSGTMHATPDGPSAAIETTTPAQRAEVLMREHDCWANEQQMPDDMVGVIPGHVVTNNGYRGAAEVGRALDQLPPSMGGPGIDHGLSVYGYCR